MILLKNKLNPALLGSGCEVIRTDLLLEQLLADEPWLNKIHALAGSFL